MATYNELPFAGQGAIVADPRNWTWFKISDTKIGILYLTLFGTTYRWMAQTVTFNGSATPVYGEPCALFDTIGSTTRYHFPRACRIAEGKFVLIAPNAFNGSGATNCSVHLFSLDGTDRFIYVNEFDNFSTQAANGGHPVEPITGNRAIVFYRSTTLPSTVRAMKINYANNALTFDSHVVLTGDGNNANQIQGRYLVKRGLDNSILLISCLYAGLAHTRFYRLDENGDQTLAGTGTELGGNLSGNDNGSRAVFPVRGNVLIQPQATAVAYSVHDSETIVSPALDYRTDAFGIISMEDTLWLNGDTFASVGNTVTAINQTNNTVLSAYPSGAAKLFIGKYNEIDYRISKASSFPIDLGKNVDNRWIQKSLFKVNDNNIAVIHTVYEGGVDKPAILLVSI